MSFHFKKATPPFYKCIGFIFIGLSVVLFAVVMFMALSRATIIVKSNEEIVNAELSLNVKEKNLRTGEVLGKLGIVEVYREGKFSSTGKGKEVPGIAEGEVVIHNKHSQNQQLIKTTRFLSESGVLFRLKKDINVPAGGSAKAEIYADKEGKSGNIGPAKFTIPGLSASLQKKIYGQSEKDMMGGIRMVSAIKQEDIDDAIQKTRASLVLEAESKLKELLNSSGQFTGIAIKDTIKEKETDVEPGEEADNFTLRLVLEVQGVAYSNDLETQGAATLTRMIAIDKKLISSNLLELRPRIEAFDILEKVANLKIDLEGKVALNNTSYVFDKQKLAGLNEQEVKEYLKKAAGIEDVEIKFFPSWMDKVPRLRDHIKIVVK